MSVSTIFKADVSENGRCIASTLESNVNIDKGASLALNSKQLVSKKATQTNEAL